MSLTDSYSGIVINQNATLSNLYAWRSLGGNWIYQTFTLPLDYPRGVVDGELHTPDISGFQVLGSITAGLATVTSVDYKLEYYAGGDGGWTSLASGTVIGSQADGQVWFDVVFPTSVPISSPLLSKQFRFGIATRPVVANPAFNQPVTSIDGGYLISPQSYAATLIAGAPFPITVGGLPSFLLLDRSDVSYYTQQGIESLAYVTPTPLLHSSVSQGQAYQADGFTPLLGLGTTASLNFRILGMVADTGVNFLNNEYRSAVISASGGNTNTANGETPIVGSGSGRNWISPPMPSRFAVQSLYFDQRPVAVTPQYGMINSILNPSFEYDPVGTTPFNWTYNFDAAGTRTSFVTSTGWAASGSQSLRITATGVTGGTNMYGDCTTTMGAVGGITYTASATFYPQNANTQPRLNIFFYDASNTILGTLETDGTATNTVQTLSVTLLAPANTTQVEVFWALRNTTGGLATVDSYMDAVMIVNSAAMVPYFDGDAADCVWAAQRGRSASARLIDPTIDDNFVVMDGIIIDPITPNMTFNVYYSQDDSYTSDHMIESDWERKLWTRVPQVFVCTQRQQYVFPEPIHAKYVKVEFTNLQAQSYDPGNFQKPISYKKFPTWVANYFLAQMELPSFIASQVNVQYDALQFAYDYFLDDLNQLPAMPSAPPQSAISQLTNYFNLSNATNGVDPVTLAKIDLTMNQFQSPLGSNVDATSSLGAFVAGIIADTSTPTVSEGGFLSPVDYSVVSSLQREPIVLEQGLPSMFFFVTCRHTYKELTAKFEFNRAYFAGVNDIAFVRHNYTVESDTTLYIESGGDQANIAFTDWTLDTDGNWYVY